MPALAATTRAAPTPQAQASAPLPPLVLDCVVFGLQRFGGISTYWRRLIDGAAAAPALAPQLVLPRRIRYAEFDDRWLRTLPTTRETLPERASRYLPAPVPVPGALFHTSYYRLPRSRVARYVVSAYDFTYERYRSGFARAVHSAQKQASLRRADAVLCNSDSTLHDVLEFCPGIDAARLHVTPLGVDTDAFFPDAGGTDAGAGADAATVLFVGQRGGYKRFDLAVEAVRLCADLRLGIVGPALTEAERATLRGRLADRWTEFGGVPSERLRRLYSSAFAFVFPSDYEGFGLPVLEAMACGCPVVCANLSSLPEVGGDAARYAAEQRAEAYAAAFVALTDPRARDAAVAAGLARVRDFTWDRMFERTFAVYAALAADGRTGR